jgi:hypothetical protein
MVTVNFAGTCEFTATVEEKKNVDDDSGEGASSFISSRTRSPRRQMRVTA